MHPDGNDEAPSGRGLTLTDVLTVPRRRWRWLVAFGIVGTAGVAGYLTLLPARYTATALVTVRPVVTDPFSYPGPGADRAINMNAEHGVATSDRVLRAVAAATGQDVSQVGDGLSVEVPVGGQLLRFGYRADSAAHALTGANTAAKAYLSARRADYVDQRDNQLHSYDGSLHALEKKETAAEHRAERERGDAGTTGSSPADDQVRALNDQISQLGQDRARIAAVDLTPGTLTNPATRPIPSNRDQALLYLLAGVLGGVLLGAIAGHARESADRRVRRAGDAVDAADAPLLGTVRRGGRVPGRAQRADVAYLALAVTELVATYHSPRLMLLSAGPDEGRADLSADLAVALAQQGERVYLGAVLGAGDPLHARVLANAAARLGSVTPSPAPVQAATGTSATVPHVGDVDDLADTAQLPVVTMPVIADDGSARGAVAVADKGVRRVVIEPGPRADDILDRAPIPQIVVGEGTVSVGPAAAAPPGALVLLDAPPAELDPRGLRVLGDDGLAVLVVARDRTRIDALRRCAQRLRAAGRRPVGVVLTGARHG